MDTVGLIIAFFTTKHLSMLTTFICWPPEEVKELLKRTSDASLRVSAASLRRPPDLPPYRAVREGVLLDVDCDGSDQVLHEASESRAFNLRYTWLLIHKGDFNVSHLEEKLSSFQIYPDADVYWVSNDTMVDVYRVKHDQPLVLTHHGVPRSREEMQDLWGSLPTAVSRRKNLNNVYLKSATIVSQPHYFRGWSDLSNRQIDTYPKLTYPLLMLMAEDLHFRHNMRQVDLYGEERNGTFDGLAGMMERGELDVGVCSMFMRADRWRVLHYSAETIQLKGAFLFRQPSRASVSNVFLLPFSRGVWAACALVVAGAATLLPLVGRLARAAPDPTLRRLTAAESFTYAIGTVCQQGSDLTSQLVSVRLLMFCTLLASLFAFTSYSAKIVAILQAPSDAIRTIPDLTRSPMEMGVQETTYKKVYFAESTDSATQTLFRRKLLPLGEKAYLSVVDGIARVRTGLFAFQVEQSSAYDVISKTYTEREKCGLREIRAFTLPMVAVPIRRHSGYKDLVGARLRWQREVGLMDRSRRVWMTGPPRCADGGGGFVSVSMGDVLPAAHLLLGGAMLAGLLLLLESLHSRFALVTWLHHYKQDPAR